MSLGTRTLGISLLIVVGGRGGVTAAAPLGRPNVIVIISDDQGHGDLGFHGNPQIRTPHLDRLARESTRLDRFYASPVCAPTRASLLTGRYAYRTGVVDTYLGRAMMHPDEVTLAEMLAAAGYRTACFGKWHLGDNYPLRAIDQGFGEALVLRGGGIGQPSDPPGPGGGSYFDPILQHNGRERKTRGYCSDVFTDAAIDFISGPRDRPFFVYLAFNAPHTPLQVPEADYLPYKAMDLGAAAFPRQGHPLPPIDQETTARVYGMVSNIDANLGRLFARLDALGLADETIVLFLTDNGPQQPRYNSGMRDRKGSVYEGGIRVPCFVRWPRHLRAGKVVDRIAAAIDVAPTVLDACGVAKPAAVAFDGRSLLPLLEGEAGEWPDRPLYVQWHRGEVPERRRAFAARTQRYKLLRPESATGLPLERSLELYDMVDDPLEFRNIADRSPEVVAQLLAGYDAWFDDVSRSRSFAPPRIVLGARAEDPSTLTRQDWRGPRAGWGPDDQGYWEVDVARPGRFDVTLRFAPRSIATRAHLALGTVASDREVAAGAVDCRFESVPFPRGPGRLEAWLASGTTTAGPSYVEVKRSE